MDIDVVFTRLAAVVNTAAVQGNTLQVTATPTMPPIPEVPHFYPYEWTASYDRTFGGLVELVSTWHLTLSRAGDEAAIQEALALSSSGESTIRAAVNTARGAAGQSALSGAADDVHLQRAQGPRFFEFGDNVGYWGVQFTIFVMG